MPLPEATQAVSVEEVPPPVLLELLADELLTDELVELLDELLVLLLVELLDELVVLDELEELFDTLLLAVLLDETLLDELEELPGGRRHRRPSAST